VTDEFEIEKLRLPANFVVPERRAVEPCKLEKRRKHFVQVPWQWVEALSGATGQTWHLAVQLLYLHWKGSGAPIKVANGMLEMDGIHRKAKTRGLFDLERRGLLAFVERGPKKTPVVRVILP
jgi:hypothetical protein